jgi:hypothetical protein
MMKNYEIIYRIHMKCFYILKNVDLVTMYMVFHIAPAVLKIMYIALSEAWHRLFFMY